MASFSIRKAYAVSSDLAENGVWQEFAGGIRLKIRRLNSEASVAARRTAEEQYKEDLRKDPVPDAVLNAIAIYQLAHGVVVDWNVTDTETGADIPFTPEAAIEAFSDPETKEFVFEVIVASNDRATFHVSRLKEDVKN